MNAGTEARVALEARGLVKRYGERAALRGIDLSVEAGELLAVIGPNGAGKTTLLSIFAGVAKADEGELSLPGAVGWVPQQAALYRRLTVEENLLLFARLERHEDPHASVEEMLELAGLAERRAETVARLSGGNQQRINIAIGLLSRPVALLLDEPSVGLDPRQRARLWEFVGGLAGRGTTVIFSTHDIQEAERYGQRLLVLADGESLFDGSAEELREAVRSEAPEAASRDFETAFVAFLHHRGTDRVRWLLLKDLQILRRSPLQAVLLVAYPVLIAILVGFAISPDSEKTRVAFLNEVPAGTRVTVGERQLPAIGVSDRICEQVECIKVKSREEAVEEVESGDALAALILPADLVDEINSLSTLIPGTPKVEVLVNEENPLKAQAVDDRITSLLAQANLVIAKRVATEGGKYLNLLVEGGEFDVLGTSIEILGLKTTGAILESLRPTVAPGPRRDALDRVIRFSSLARENLGVAQPLVERLAQPIEVEKQVIDGDSPPLDIFAIAVAATLTLAFVTVLLVAGSLALEREENAFARLTRSLISPSALLGEKVVLGVVAGLVVTLLMLAGLQFFVPLQWDRFGLWLAAIAGGGAALGAAGAALGAAAREVRAVSLLAFMVTLPIAFLSLVPSGAVGKSVFDAIEIVVAIFPFKPALDAMTAALDPAGGSVGGPLLHLAILAVAYGVLARLALRRFTAV